MLPFVVWTCYIVSTCQLTLTVASTHFPHHTNAMTVIRCHPNVCGALVRIPKQTFRDVTSIQQLLVGPSNSVFFSTHSSYRLDKINSDMRNYITNFAADLRWIQVQLLPLPLCCCHVAAVRCQSQLARRPADIFNMDALQSKHSRPVNERSPGAICSYCQSTRQWCTQCRFDFSCCSLHQRAFRVFFFNIVLKIRYVVLVPQHLHLIAGCFYPSMSLSVQKVDITLQIRRALLQHHKMDWETFNHTGIFMLPNTSVYLYKKPRNCLLIPACH